MSNMLVSCISDAASLIGAPTDIAKHFLQKRQHELQNIILQEIREGDFSKINQDDIISIVYRLLNDINEGVGKNNIRLLARLITGLNTKQQLTASRFHKFNTIIANLSHEEIVFLATVIKNYKNAPQEIMHQPAFLDILICQNPKTVYAVSETIKEHKTHILFSLLKTGFFQYRSAKANHLDPNAPYEVSPLFIEFMELIPNWEDIANWKEE